MRRILVTGSGGQLGLTFQELAHDFPEASFDFKTLKKLDITKPKELEKLFSKENYDFCINCAAYTHVEDAEKYPEKAFEVNAEGVKNLAEACKDYKTTLIHISTDYVFDGEKEGPYTVDDKTNPINEYGRSKLKGEEFIQEILPNHFIIRTSWLYSKKYGHNFYRTILKKALAGEDLYITDAQTGCPTDAEALAKFILNEIVLEKKPFGIYHFTDGKPMTWYEFAKQILDENALTGKVKLVLDTNYRTFAKRPRNSVLS
ncbi:dTDP-4-dehydrorhamnose reductase [Flagellimonas halotolerans]|uniref:dTDP-4-dehydrorhamnose reductase n=1 Tax=Flagellimonas halotolerans TaxID=3112164 RepID=A0ABU6ILI1_9FLAO|nr:MULTISPECIES: dTDP-4-dehydrorhamnose reductase [unclassified Allomuricauda]MEC3963962.1 dTDP-4-dehydrorhamnose reductase [Muricauda sp. SYSU M86414]MEC4263832.1 dTDP-4-dehydrorhamnose reductase [Muricauda sp. SYSU M84420]